MFRSLQDFGYASAMVFIIFIIKPNPICENNNPKLQTIFKKIRISIKMKDIIHCKEIPLRFGRVPRPASAELQPQH